MDDLVSLQSESGPVLFAVSPTRRTEQMARDRSRVVTELNVRLDDALAIARPAASAVLRNLASLAPDSLEVEFGIAVDAEAGAIIARGGVEGHFAVKLIWDHRGTADNHGPDADDEDPRSTAVDPPRLPDE